MCRLLQRFLRWPAPFVLAFALLQAGVPAHAVVEVAGPLTYEPIGLAWTAQEVARASADALRPLAGASTEAVRTGCSRSCVRARRIFKRLLPLARAQTAQSAALAWTLTVVRTPGFEAFSLPGGQIVVSERFIEESRLGDAEIAFVLAHEMAHCVLEHERQALTFARMLLPHDVPRSARDVYVELDYNFALLKATEFVLQQGEYEADELGLLLASSAGYAPRRQLAFIEREARREDARAPLVRTHPPAAERLTRLRDRLPLAERLHAAAPASPR